MQVVPGTHRAQVEHVDTFADTNLLSRGQEIQVSVKPEDVVPVVLRPGQMSLHDVYMIHGAAANTSGKRRTGVALRYMPSTSVFERNLRPADGKTGIAVNFANRPLWLVRGVDRSGRNDFEVGHRRG